MAADAPLERDNLIQSVAVLLSTIEKEIKIRSQAPTP